MTVMTSAATRAASVSSVSGSPMTTPPLFIFGCPRSGTTFLGELLNQHPRVLITNEIRMMTFLTEVFERTAQNRHLLHNPDHKDQFVAHARSQSEYMVRSYYDRLRRDIGKDVLVWGDKTPGYADPLLSRGCLQFTNEIFPDARWIHIRRDPRAVVHSLVTKRWHTLASAVDIWARITKAGRDFGRSLPKCQYLEITHEAVLDDVEGVARDLLDFLGLDMTPEMDAFVQSEKRERKPVSDPVNLSTKAAGQNSANLHHGLSQDQVEQVIALLGDRFDDVEAMLAHYAHTDAGRATAKAIANGGGVIATDDAGAKAEKVSKPSGFSSFSAVNQKTLLGDLEARISGVSVLVRGESAVPDAAATVFAGDRVDIAIRLMALKAFPHLVAGFSIVDQAGLVVGGGNNANSGLGTEALTPGTHTLLLSFRWPDLGDAPFTLTLGIGEGKGSPADGEANHVQCWAPQAITLRQRPRELPPVTTVAVSLMHTSVTA